MQGDVIIKSRSIGEHFYFVHSGKAQAILENRDFAYYDFHETKEFMNQDKEVAGDD